MISCVADHVHYLRGSKLTVCRSQVQSSHTSTSDATELNSTHTTSAFHEYLSDGRRQTAPTQSGIPFSGLAIHLHHCKRISDDGCFTATDAVCCGEVRQSQALPGSSRQPRRSLFTTPSVPTGCRISEAFWQVYIVRQSFPRR
jgi:hypothetical protein